MVKTLQQGHSIFHYRQPGLKLHLLPSTKTRSAADRQTAVPIITQTIDRADGQKFLTHPVIKTVAAKLTVDACHAGRYLVIFLRVYIYMHVCIYMCMCVYMCMYIYGYLLS